jgi:hypothetical protein
VGLRSLARLLELRVRIPPGPWMSISCEYCVLSGKGLCDGLITRPEESSPLCVCVCALGCDQMQQETFTLTMIR